MAKTLGTNTTVARTGVKAVAVPKGLKKLATVATGILPAIAASPAFALVDDRLNGDGAGIALGVNDPVLAWHMTGVFCTIWALYAVAARGFGAQEEEDGLSL